MCMCLHHVYLCVSVCASCDVSSFPGFSSFKFVPGTRDQHIVALKTVEFEGRIQTFITVFALDGRVLMDVTLVGLCFVFVFVFLIVLGEYKYEGLEFI